MSKREYAYMLLAAILGVTASIAVGEIGARMLAPPWLEYRMTFLRSGQADSDGGSDLSWPVDKVDGQFVRFNPLNTFRVANPEYLHAVHIDAFGGRSSCVDGNHAPTRSVAILGDSFTFGIGVEDCDTFASLLASAHRDWRFLNLGVPGSALPQQLFIASQREGDIGNASDYLFFFFLGNDYADMMGARPYWWEAPQRGDDKRRESAANPSVPRRLLEYVNYLSHREPFSHSYFLQLSRTVAMRAYLGARATSVDPIFKAMFVSDSDYVAAMRTVLSENLTYLQIVMKKANGKAAIVVIPDKNQLLDASRGGQAQYYGIALESLDRFLPNRILAEESAIAGITLVDPSGCLDKRPDKTSFYYIKDNHFTKAGHRAFFECIKGPLSVFWGDVR